MDPIHDTPPTCPRCGDDMTLVARRDADGNPATSEQDEYECPECGARVFDM